MTRLLIVTTTPATLRGFLLPYARHFRRLGWTVDAATGDGEAEAEVAQAFANLWRLPWSRRLADRTNVLAAPRAMRRVLARHSYDIVHTHTPVASFVTRAAAASLPPSSRPAMVYTAHGFHFHPRGKALGNRTFAAAERVAGRWTDRLLVINDEDRRAALERRIVPADRLRHVPGIGIELDWYAASAELLAAADGVRAQLGLAPDDRLFTIVAEMQPGKNHLAALHALSRAGTDAFHLALAGDGPRRADLEREAARLGLHRRTHFLGQVRDVRPLVLASTATVLPSRREGLSRAVLESLALGVPVIGGNVRGIADLVGTDGGILLDPDDVDGLADALHRVQAFPPRQALRTQLDSRLRHYALDSLLRLHEEVYGDVLADRRRTSARRDSRKTAQ